MNSKTSFCNKTIIKNDLKRLWWASVLSAILLFLVVVIPTLDSVNRYSTWYPERTQAWRIDRISNYFTNYSYFGMFIGMGTALVLSALLFNYLNRANAVSCIHGLPIKRTTLYFSHLISGVILLAIPIIIVTPFLISCINDGLSGVEIFKFIYAYAIYSLCFLTFGTFIGMLTGNSASHIIFTVIALLIPLFFTMFFVVVGEQKLYGFYSSTAIQEALLEYVYLFPGKLFDINVLIYFAAIIVSTVLGVVFYNKRGLENHGEVIAFPTLKGVFKVLVGICAGILGFFYTVGMWGTHQLLYMIPFAIVGLLIAHMLAQKSFSLRGVVPSLAVTVAMILAFTGIIEFDLIGFENRVPDTEDVESVRFMGDYVDETFYIHNDKNGTSTEYYYLDVFRPVYSQPEEIELFTTLHKYKIQNRDSFDNNNMFYPYSIPRSFRIEYTLKNGRKMYRSYQLTESEAREYMAPIYETETALMYNYPILDDTEKTIVSVGVSDIRDVTGKAHLKLVGTTEEAQRLVEAIKEDRKNLTFDRYLQKQQREGNTTISIEYTKPGIERFGHSFANNTIRESYNISEDDVNTLRVLKEIGFFENEHLVSVEDVSYVVANVYSMQSNGKYINPALYTSAGKDGAKQVVSYDGPTVSYRAPGDKEITEEVVYYEVAPEIYENPEYVGVVFDSPEDIKQLHEFAIENGTVFPARGASNAVEIKLDFIIENEHGNYEVSKNFWSSTLTLPAVLKNEWKFIDEIVYSDTPLQDMTVYSK